MDGASTTAAAPLRARPLPLRVGSEEVLLLADDANVLIQGVRLLAQAIAEDTERSLRRDGEVSLDVVRQLAELADLLAAAAQSFSDPPLELDPPQRRLARQALADLSGYRRIDLPPALGRLREELGESLG